MVALLAKSASGEIVISTATDSGADTYVQNNGSGPYATATAMQIKLASTGNEAFTRKAYFRFDLTGLDVSQIQSAQINLTTVATGGGVISDVNKLWTFSVYGLTNQSLDSWAASTMKWADAPANQLAPPQVDSAITTLVGQFSFANKTPAGTAASLASISGTSLVDFLKADTNGLATFILVRDTVETSTSNDTYVHCFASAESTTATGPQLLVTVPEPSALVLGAIAGLAAAFVFCRRRRVA